MPPSAGQPARSRRRHPRCCDGKGAICWPLKFSTLLGRVSPKVRSIGHVHAAVATFEHLERVHDERPVDAYSRCSDVDDPGPEHSPSPATRTGGTVARCDWPAGTSTVATSG